jgi:hypothetical protein
LPSTPFNLKSGASLPIDKVAGSFAMAKMIINEKIKLSIVFIVVFLVEYLAI